MNFNISDKPIYQQIAEMLMDKIMRGELVEGGRAQGVRETSVELEVNVNTVTKSYDYLLSRELIYNKRGVGYFVAPGARDRIMAQRESDFLHKESPTLFRRLRDLGISPERLEHLYAQYLKDNETCEPPQNS